MSTAEPAHCVDCDRDIEVCALCGQEECSKGLCYRCTILAVGEARPEPHDHGG